MAPYAPFSQRMVLANLWLTGPLVRMRLRAAPLGAALMHTTIAPTMLSAGIKDNVLPPEASAVVNFRLRPGETVASVTERVRTVIDDSLISIAPIDSAGVDPSPVSAVGSPAWELIASTVRDGIVRIGFLHTAYSGQGCENRSTGWYIDHIRITKLPPEICWCDLNGDGICNILDWPLFIQDWGRTNCGTPPGTGDPPNDCECDIRTDGACNILDWPLFIEDWGKKDWCPK